VELNDRYSGDTSRTRLNAMLRYDNLWQREHSLTLNAQTAPEQPEESKVLSASYLFRMPGSDDLMALYAVRSRSDVAAVGDLSVIGDGNIYGARYILPLRGREDFFHSLTLGVDRKDFLESVVLQGADSLNTPIDYTPLVLDYSATSQDKNGLIEFGAGATMGLRGVLGNNEQEFADKRFKAHANYLALRVRVGAVQKLPAGFSLSSRLDSQLASGPLISSEQFSAGGQDSVRGYREAEALGDDGYRASLELRHPFPQAWTADRFDEFYGLGFFEAARLWIHDPLPAQQDEFVLAGAGVGLRAKLRKRISLGLDVAYPFKDAAYTQRGDTRAHFNLTYEF
jgi:hemolysin activation/secretion protein